MRSSLKDAAVCAIGMGALGFTGQTVAGDTINVGPGQSLQAAIVQSSDGDLILVAPGTYGPINPGGKLITVRGSSGPDVTTIQANGGTVVHCISGESIDTLIEGFTITGGDAAAGAGMLIHDSSPVFRDCFITDNHASGVGGAVDCRNGSPRFDGCVFFDNTAVIGVGAMFSDETSHPVFVGCTFLANSAELVGALGAWQGTAVGCRFLQNQGDVGGAAAVSDFTFINCVFSRNVSGGNSPGAVTGGGAFFNCSFSNNVGYGISADSVNSMFLANCILWGNSLGSAEQPGGDLTINYSNIEGGFPGLGNIDVDPLFVQPGTDDLHLSFGSPCLEAGQNTLVPADTADIDGDGDTDEMVPYDAGGAMRIINRSVDMGAYEGDYEMQPAAWSESNLDPGDWAELSPSAGAGPIQLLQHATQWLTNVSGAENSTAVATEHLAALHDDAGGYTELSSILDTETTMTTGQFLSTIILPFEATDLLAGAEPFDLEITVYDPQTGGWVLAVSRNATSSPGHGGPVGDRITVVAPGTPGITEDLGDYGVFWNPIQERGYAWANVDADRRYAVGAPRCFGDVANPPDGVVTAVDLLDLIRNWGHRGGGGTRWDLDGNGIVGPDDLFALMQAWGVCQ